MRKESLCYSGGKMTYTDNEIIYKALVEYENNHWGTEDSKWQKQINRLESEYRSKIENREKKNET